MNESKIVIEMNENNSNSTEMQAVKIKPDSKDVWTQFVDVTSFHGIIDITSPYGKLWKFCWLILMLFGLAMTVRGIASMFGDYRDSPTAVQVRKRPNNTLNLPDIIICPENGMSQAKLKSLGVSEDLAFGLNFLSDDFYLDFIPNSVPSANRGLLNRWINEFEIFQANNGNMSMSELIRNASISCEEFIVSCKIYFKFLPASKCCQNSEIFINRNMKQCFRLRKLGMQTFPSYQAGLSVILNLSSVEGDQMLTSSVQGVQVQVLHRNDWTNRNFFKIQPNTSTFLMIQYQEINRVNDPYQPPICNHQDPARANISGNGCFYNKWAELVHKKCGCVPLSYDFEHFRKCKLFELEQTCFSDPQVFDALSKQIVELQKYCLPSCKSQQYDAVLSSSVFNPSLFETSFNRFKNASANFSSSGLDNFRAGWYIAIGMFYPEMAYTEMTEVPIYSLETFISNIGGILGLWLGASILSVFQAIAYFLLWLFLKYKKIMKDTDKT